MSPKNFGYSIPPRKLRALRNPTLKHGQSSKILSKSLKEERNNLGNINDIDFLANHCTDLYYLLGISCVPM